MGGYTHTHTLYIYFVYYDLHCFTRRTRRIILSPLVSRTEPRTRAQDALLLSCTPSSLVVAKLYRAPVCRLPSSSNQTLNDRHFQPTTQCHSGHLCYCLLTYHRTFYSCCSCPSVITEDKLYSKCSCLAVRHSTLTTL